MNRPQQHSSKFCRKLPLAVGALLRSHSVAEAAQSIEISESTLKRWKREPAFAEALVEAQSEIFHSVTNSLRESGKSCAEILGRIAMDKKAPTASRVRAAIAVVNFLLKLHEQEDVEFRLTRLESIAKRRQSGGVQ